jgi:hypothetical protein
MQAQVALQENAFNAAGETFDALVDDLGAPPALAMTHGELEVMIGERGREVLRLLLQSRVALRDLGEVDDFYANARRVPVGG